MAQIGRIRHRPRRGEGGRPSQGPHDNFEGVESMAEKLSEAERASWRAELEHLRQQHRDLDAAIEALMHRGAADQLQVQRLKKRKLALRDRAAFIEDLLTPDIIA